MLLVDQLILKMQFSFAMQAPKIQLHEPSHPMRPDACRHVARPVLPARLAAGGRHRQKPQNELTLKLLMDKIISSFVAFIHRSSPSHGMTGETEHAVHVAHHKIFL
jgi:hypothetical protein